MKAAVSGERVLKLGKAFLLAVLIFIGLTSLFCLLIWLTPVPERWSAFYGIGVLSLSCLIFGLLGGRIIGKRGLFIGGGASLMLLLTILAGSVFFTQTPTSAEIFHLKYLPCIFCGCIGGVLGVNLSSKN
ncbi:MAG: TIGR04086 family membrane protein [Anaerovoracaceae bacterium]|nr:TIGR04086 family membrane protein [Bacillota bacterium]MDY3954809.1 TIGR04086 family membrane protein [Anaerovoracaceae bacterium]